MTLPGVSETITVEPLEVPQQIPVEPVPAEPVEVPA